MFEQFYKYKIKKRLGSGGMGDVYLAYDTVQNREIALKLVPDDQDSEGQEKVQAERKGAELQHRLARYSQHVPKIHEYGNHDGFLYIDMEYVEGDDLAKLIFSNPLPYYQIPDIGIQICEVLQVAHSLEEPIDGQPIKGIAHGDIKPKNIRIKQGQVKLLDYGIAKALSLTRSLARSAFGSVEYCSPERLKDGELAPAADLWALGVVLYEAVSRKKPFQASTTQGVEKRICSGQPPPPLPDHCPKLLSEIIFKALKFNKNERYQSAAEFKADLEQAKQGETRKIPKTVTPVQPVPPVKNPPNPPVPPSSGQPPTAKRKRVIVGAVAALVVIGLLLGFGVNEYKVWADTSELSRDASAAQVIHLSDLAGLEQRYNELKKRGFMDWGLVSIRERFKSGLMGIADRVVDDYRKDVPKLGRPDWTEARDSMRKVVEYFPNDSMAKAKAHFFDGLIARSAGRDEKKNKKDGSANFREAIRHFNDAMVLQEDWPDPHLGLAIVYSYDLVDPKAAADEIAKLREKGFELGIRREHAMKADALRMSANDLYNRAKKRSPLDLSELQSIRQRYQDAQDHYAQIQDSNDTAKEEVRNISETLREIDEKIAQLENLE